MTINVLKGPNHWRRWEEERERKKEKKKKLNPEDEFLVFSLSNFVGKFYQALCIYQNIYKVIEGGDESSYIEVSRVACFGRTSMHCNLHVASLVHQLAQQGQQVLWAVGAPPRVYSECHGALDFSLYLSSDWKNPTLRVASVGMNQMDGENNLW